MKKIIHIDADCFYAAVEMRENPNLMSSPVAVGGNPEKRGVIATCNYEARKFGVHSAMSSAQARKLCPSLHIIPPRISLYKEYSAAMREIFNEYTDSVEPLSLDEAYLDVSDVDKLRGSATLIAGQIKSKIMETLGISVSAGVAPVKFLAKIASDWQKPDGLFVISPEMVDSFVSQLPVRKLPGVGPVTADKLARNGMYKCSDLRERGLNELIHLFGAYGPRLYKMSVGVDDRNVVSHSERKSLSVERTYASDYCELQSLYPLLDDLLVELNKRTGKIDCKNTLKKAFVKIKFNDFSITTMESSYKFGSSNEHDLFRRLLSAAWQRKKRPIRLLGVGFRLDSRTEKQLEFDF